MIESDADPKQPNPNQAGSAVADQGAAPGQAAGPQERTLQDRPRGPLALTIIAGIAVGAAITLLGPILKPLLIAVFLYFMIKPVAEELVRLGLRPYVAWFSLFGMVLIAFALVGRLVYNNAMSFQASWPTYEQEIVKRVKQVQPDAGESIGEITHLSAVDVFKYALTTTVSVFETSVLVFFYLLFIILSAGKLEPRVRRSFVGERGERIVTLTRKVIAGVEHFIKVKTAVNLGLGATIAVILYPFGLDHWLLWAFLFAALNYITYIGSIAACVPTVLAAFVQLDMLPAVVLTTIVIAARIVWIDYLEIRLLGRSLNLDSILLFLWLAYWGWVWGVVGLVLAVPTLTSLKIVLAHIEATRGLASVMSEE
jgi:predicted PurR-regulated permease PerM